MFDKLLFQAQFNTGQTIRLNTAEGMILDSCDANIGVLKGKARTVPAILCDGASDTEQWKIINIVDNNGMFLDHVAIKGAVSDDQASRLCTKYLREARRGQLNNPIEISNNGLKTFLDSVRLPSGTSYFLEVDAPLLDAQGTVNPVQWDDQGNLISHGGRLSHMMLDMAGCDIQGNLLEQVTPRDIVAMLLDSTSEIISRGMFDAMIIKYNQFEKVIQKIAEALKTSDNEEFFVKTVTPIEPFKRQGVVNVGAIFEMSDTQTITVLFNNPDTTPAKLAGTDILTSWKWILNKRDVTAILQPRAVDARKYPQLATRMLKVLAKNHDRFKRAQMARSKEELLLEELTNELEAKQSELRTLQQQGTDLQSQIDEETTRKQQQTETIAATPTAPSKSDVIGKFEKIIDILTGQHDFKVEFRGEDAEALEQMHVTLLDKNERDVNFIVTEGVQGAGLEYRISTNAYSFSWDIKDSAEQTAQAIADASAEFNKSLLEGSAVKCPYTVEQITASIRNLGKQDAKSMRVAYKTFNQERDDKNIALVEANPEMIDQVYAIFAKEGNQEKMPGHIPELLELEKTTDFPVLLVYNVIRNLDFAKAFSEGAQDLIKQKQLADEAQNTGIKLSAGDFVTGKFANLNKNNSVAEYRDEVEQNAYKESVCIVQKAITLSPEEYDSFANSLLKPNEKIAGLGGTWVDDDQKPREQQNYMSIVVAVMAQGRETLLIDPQQYNYARYVALDPKKIEAPEAFKDVYIDASGEIKDRAKDGNEGGADEITDATNPDQYAKIIDDDAQLTEWQDPLDSFFQSRLIETRNALRELGWTGEKFKDLSKDGHTLVMDLKQVGGGANVVGVTYSVSDTDFSVRDDLKLDAQALASLIDGTVQGQAAVTLSPGELDQLVNDFAVSKGMQEYGGYRILGNLSLMSRPGLGDVILLAGNPNEENNGLRESKTIAEVTGNEIFELTAEKLESVFGPLIDQEIERLKVGAPALKPTNYTIKNPNPRARKPRGTITLKPLDSDQSGNYEVTIVKDSVGGQFVGTIEEAKNWLIHRLMDMGEAVSDKGYSFADTAQKLDLVIGEDVLGIKTLPENPYQNAALIDLAKGVVKELAALGWEKSGSTVVKTIDVNGEPKRLKFDFNPTKKGNELWIKDESGESIGEFAMPELTEIGVKEKAQEMDAVANGLANIQNEQDVQMNNDEPGGIVLKAEAEDAYRMLDHIVLDYQGHTADEFKRADVPGKFKPWIEKAEAVLQRKFRNESYRAEIERSIERANETIARWERVQAEAAPQTPPVVESEQDVQMNNDEQFLNDVIAGAVDLLANDTGDRIEQIGENLDPALESLFEQAIDAYSQAAIKNAQSMG